MEEADATLDEEKGGSRDSSVFELHPGPTPGKVPAESLTDVEVWGGDIRIPIEDFASPKITPVIYRRIGDYLRDIPTNLTCAAKQFGVDIENASTLEVLGKGIGTTHGDSCPEAVPPPGVRPVVSPLPVRPAVVNSKEGEVLPVFFAETKTFHELKAISRAFCAIHPRILGKAPFCTTPLFLSPP